MRNPKFTSLLNWVCKVSVFKLLSPRSFATKTRNEIRKRTQDAMFDYFHHNRGLDYLIAESMSKNAPVFNANLLKKLNVVAFGDDLVRSITRFLWFHPVNEFEPFLESLGLKPSEFSHLVPCDKMFLNEDAFLLENYYVFWNYGIGREKMGKIFREAREVFGYENGVLASKIQAYEDLGFSKLVLSKVIVCSPQILIGDVNVDVVRVMEMFRCMGFGFDWVVENLKEEESCDWSSVYRVLSFLRDLFGDEKELGELIRKQPRLVFEDSGAWTLILAGFETKFGLSRSELCLLFQKLTESQCLAKYVLNLRGCFMFLKDIEMEADEIGKVFRSHSWWLGVSRLKQTSTLLLDLKTGKRRLCQVIKEHPEEMKKWIVGLRVQPLPVTGVDPEWKTMKTQFLLDLGYMENSKEIEIAFKSFLGKGSELRERFNFLVSLGLNAEDVKGMVKVCPRILSQSSDVLEPKVNYLVNELNYPLSTLAASPICLRYTLQRMKLRFAMFSWLVDRGKADPNLAISTILAYSDKNFLTRLVNRHPDGPKHFKDILWNYGIGREKIIKEARESFGYETGGLTTKLQAYEDLGFSKLFLSKVTVCSPGILNGNVNVEVAKVVEMLKSMGFGFDWVEENLLANESHDWSSMYRVLSYLRDLCEDENEVCELIRKRPGLLFEDSGEWTLILAGFETKLGSSRSELGHLFRNFPQVQVEKCVSNLRHCFLFLKEIEMEDDEIRKVFRSHSWWLASCKLKKTGTLLVNLKTWKNRIRQVIIETPEEIKKWTLGSKIQPLPAIESEKMKTQFLLDLGYKENSKEMEVAVRNFRGKGSELQNRFNFFVSLGLDEKDVKNMVKACPSILSQSSDVVETKVNYLVNELGYPVSTLVAFPLCMKYTLQRIKLRFAMFSWLVARGKADPKTAVNAILLYSDENFMSRWVNRHPDGPKQYEDLKKELLCE